MLMAAVSVAVGLTVTAVPAAATTFRNCRPLALRSVENGLFVSAEVGYPGDSNGILRARSARIGPWERFNICDTSGPRGTYKTFYSIDEAQDGFVTDERGLGDGIRARKYGHEVGPWEEFGIARLDGCGPECYAIYSFSAAKWIKVDVGIPQGSEGHAMLWAGSDQVGPWEKINFVWLS